MEMTRFRFCDVYTFSLGDTSFFTRESDESHLLWIVLLDCAVFRGEKSFRCFLSLWERVG